ncbi:MAG: ATP-dependent DNA helicase [Pseudomonadota bacterium]
MTETPFPDSPDEASTLPQELTAIVPARLDAPLGWGAVAVSADGEIEELGATEALDRLSRAAVLCVHGGFTARRIALGLTSRKARTLKGTVVGPQVFDLLDLFAFVHPASPCLPTPSGLIRALGLSASSPPEDQALTLHVAAHRLLATLRSPHYPDRASAARIAIRMDEARWVWGPAVKAALADIIARDGRPPIGRGFDVWNDLAEWEDDAPRPTPSSLPVSEDEARARLAALVGPGAEARPAQSDFAAATARAFNAREAAGAPNIVIAEAGTGIGKTLGYIAPASLWAERNKGTVWLSTYTKNLQRQLDQELTRLYPDPAEKSEKAVIRKGRENYLCLLNFEELAVRAATSGQGVTVGLIARWARASRDGDMVGGDFPAWLTQRMNVSSEPRGALTDRRGECIYSACTHFKKCFIEKAIRKARRADIVVANHALVMRQAALDQAVALLAPKANAHTADAAGNSEDEEPSGREARSRFVFDEGHHIFDAADSAFSTHLSALETAELRRWIRGPEGARGRRGRGLEDRIADLVSGDTASEEALSAAMTAALTLPSTGWGSRLNEGTPKREAEFFLALVDKQVHARTENDDTPFSLEADVEPLVDGLALAARAFDLSLQKLITPLLNIADGLRTKLDNQTSDLDSATRTRMDAAARGLERRAKILIPSWRAMLAAIGQPTPQHFVDWFSIERVDGRDIDVGMHRHWRDPSEPFAQSVLEPAHGVVITSATLRDRLPDDEADDDNWQSAEIRTGVVHLATPARRAFMLSPFDYARQARIYVVRDVKGSDMDQVAAATRELFLASGGGALGLFTAIHRLRNVHERILAPLEQSDIPLYAQHVDALDTSTLVDIFRAEENSCLLGTDAVRDGVDVPGRSLRMIVFDRTPWPRPDILHKARRSQFGGARYDDMLTRLRLKQAFGRLIRSQSDKGVFVMLDARLPTRLTSAFPDGVVVERVGLADAIAGARAFLATPL